MGWWVDFFCNTGKLSQEEYEDTQLPFTTLINNVKPQENQVVTECYEWQHDFVNVGFHFDKWVCKKCDKEKV